MRARAWKAGASFLLAATFGLVTQVASASALQVTFRQVAPGKHLRLASISCPGVHLCLGEVDSTTGNNVGFAVSNNPTAPDSWRILRSTSLETEISCPVTTVCFAWGRDGLMVDTRPGARQSSFHWVLGGPVSDIAANCATATFCSATESGSADEFWISTNPGVASAWRARPYPSLGAGSQVAVTCLTRQVCIALVRNGRRQELMTLTSPLDPSSKWVNTVNLDSEALPTGGSCPGIAACIFDFAQGQDLLASSNVLAPSSWTTYRIGADETGQLSCPTVDSCYMLSANRYRGHWIDELFASQTALAASGQRWLGYQLPAEAQEASFESMQCVRDSLCYGLAVKTGNVAVLRIAHPRNLTPPPPFKLPPPAPVTPLLLRAQVNAFYETKVVSWGSVTANGDMHDIVHMAIGPHSYEISGPCTTGRMNYNRDSFVLNNLKGDYEVTCPVGGPVQHNFIPLSKECLISTYVDCRHMNFVPVLQRVGQEVAAYAGLTAGQYGALNQLLVDQYSRLGTADAHLVFKPTAGTHGRQVREITLSLAKGGKVQVSKTWY